MAGNAASPLSPEHPASPPGPRRPPRLDPRILESATARYRAVGRFAYHFARGKLAGDPAFAAIVHQSWIGAARRVLDLGCGQGLLASLLLAAGHGCRVRGIEVSPAEARRARTALGDAADIVCGDIRQEDFGETDAAVILDVLHYIDYPAQDDVLRRLRAALRPGGVLLLRVGDANAGLSFHYGSLVDRLVFLARGNRPGRLFCRPLVQWRKSLEALDFEVEVVPLSQGTLFANVMLRARLPGA